MLSYTTAKKLLDPGDTVYIVMGGRIVETSVLKIRRDSLLTPEDELFFDEVGKVWFMTKRGALDALKTR